jgi:glutamate dehydrogenase (NADP+)
MLELWRLIGPNTDVPAGDIGVGGREIGYLYGMYRKLARENTGVFTGKGLNWGGSLIRPEATGFGVVYFAQEMLKVAGETFKGKKVAISGFGNVAWGAAIKVTELGGKVVTLSGPDGYVHVPDGLSPAQIEYMLELRATNEDIVKPFSYEFEGVQFIQGRHPWEIPCEIALPCATQNELNKEDAISLVNNGCICVTEGANMPCTPEAIEHFQDKHVLYSPGKASNAGGVATSGLEMAQNSMKINWSRKEVDDRLHHIMTNIHSSCVKHGKRDNGYVDYVRGANIAGFLKVANSMMDQGLF